MADKSVGELIAAQSVTPTDLFVLEQNGTAKKLTGQVLENWLVSFADGHGGIKSIVKHSTDVLVDTYRITLADTTTFDFVVNNGRGINTIEKTGTSGLVDTYTITFNDATSSTFEVVNGAKGDKGDNTYTHIKYASQKPTASSHSMGDVADNWIGIYFGASETAPTDWTQYEWFQIKGEKGETGEPATLNSSSVEYQVSDSGTIIPSGAWSASIPVVAQGKYLWTRTTQTFNTGSPVISYSVSRMGIDGTGSVSSVAGVSPDENGDVPLTAEDFGALSIDGGVLNGSLNMNGQKLSGLNAPTENDEAATKGYVDNAKPDMTGYATETYVNSAVKKAVSRNLLDNSDFTNPVNESGEESYEMTAAWTPTINNWEGTYATVSVNDGFVKLKAEKIVQYKRFGQYVSAPVEAGKTYTMALCAKINDIGGYFTIRPMDNLAEISGCAGVNISVKPDDYEVFTYSFTLTEKPTKLGIEILMAKNAETFADIDIKWFALYEGEYTTDTLPDYVPKEKVVEELNCGIVPFSPDLLWQNASVESRFDPQTVVLGLNEYEWLLLEWTFSNENDNRYTMLIPTRDTSVHEMHINATSNNRVGGRRVSVNGNDVVFENGNYNAGENNKNAIPTRIWGLKEARA